MKKESYLSKIEKLRGSINSMQNELNYLRLFVNEMNDENVITFNANLLNKMSELISIFSEVSIMLNNNIENEKFKSDTKKTIVFVINKIIDESERLNAKLKESVYHIKKSPII